MAGLLTGAISPGVNPLRLILSDAESSGQSMGESYQIVAAD